MWKFLYGCFHFEFAVAGVIKVKNENDNGSDWFSCLIDLL